MITKGIGLEFRSVQPAQTALQGTTDKIPSSALLCLLRQLMNNLKGKTLKLQIFSCSPSNILLSSLKNSGYLLGEQALLFPKNNNKL